MFYIIGGNVSAKYHPSLSAGVFWAVPSDRSLEDGWEGVSLCVGSLDQLDGLGLHDNLRVAPLEGGLGHRAVGDKVRVGAALESSVVQLVKLVHLVGVHAVLHP